MLVEATASACSGMKPLGSGLFFKSAPLAHGDVTATECLHYALEPADVGRHHGLRHARDPQAGRARRRDARLRAAPATAPRCCAGPTAAVEARRVGEVQDHRRLRRHRPEPVVARDRLAREAGLGAVPNSRPRPRPRRRPRFAEQRRTFAAQSRYEYEDEDEYEYEDEGGLSALSPEATSRRTIFRTSPARGRGRHRRCRARARTLTRRAFGPAASPTSGRGADRARQPRHESNLGLA